MPTKSILKAANVPIIGGHHVLALHLAEKAELDPRPNPQGRATNLDLDRRRARTVLVFRHHRNKIRRYLPPPHRTLFGDAVAALGKNVELALLRQQLKRRGRGSSSSRPCS